MAGCGCFFQPFRAPLPMKASIWFCTDWLNAFGPLQPANVEPSAGNVEVTPAIEKQLSLPLPSYMTSLPLVSAPPLANAVLRTMVRCRAFASGVFLRRIPRVAGEAV